MESIFFRLMVLNLSTNAAFAGGMFHGTFDAILAIARQFCLTGYIVDEGVRCDCGDYYCTRTQDYEYTVFNGEIVNDRDFAWGVSEPTTRLRLRGLRNARSVAAMMGAREPTSRYVKRQTNRAERRASKAFLAEALND